MTSSRQNRKILTVVLILVAAAMLLAVYFLYFRSRGDLPNEPTEKTSANLSAPAAGSSASTADPSQAVFRS